MDIPVFDNLHGIKNSTGRITAMIEKITEYILNTDGALLRLAISLIVFAVSYLISRLVRHKVMPWLMNLLSKKEKKGPYVLAKGFSRPAPVAVWTTGIFLA